MVRDNMAFGWKAFGETLDEDRIETLLIPLESSSMFQRAVSGSRFWHGPPLPSTLHTYLYRVLRCSAPPFSTVGVVSIADRAVNLVYGHHAESIQLAEKVQEEFKSVCDAAGEAYVRLIELAKGEKNKTPATKGKVVGVLASGEEDESEEDVPVTVAPPKEEPAPSGGENTDAGEAASSKKEPEGAEAKPAPKKRKSKKMPKVKFDNDTTAGKTDDGDGGDAKPAKKKKKRRKRKN